jgi:hypothetical protein
MADYLVTKRNQASSHKIQVNFKCIQLGKRSYCGKSEHYMILII